VRIVDPATHGTLSGRVRRASDGAPLPATIVAGALSSRADAATGAYLHRLAAGTQTLSVTLAGYETATPPAVTINVGTTTPLDVSLYALCARAAQDAEAGPGDWVASAPWGIAGPGATPGPVLANRAWADSPGGNYAANANISLTSPVVDLTGYEAPVLGFDSWCDTQEGSDFGRVEYRIGSGAWTEAWRCSGEPSWRRIELPLPALAGMANAQLRFRFSSNASIQDDGWYIDDVQLTAGGPACRATQDDRLLIDGFEAGSP
jgi:hypothetical protein